MFVLYCDLIAIGFFFQRRCIHALMTRIAILGQRVKMENASVEERELETGNTAEVRLIIYTDLKIYESYLP